MSASAQSITMREAAEPILKTVTVIADDYGMAAEVDQAVLALARRGRLSGTSVLSLGAHWREGAAALAELPELQIGLHVDLPPGHDGLGAAMLKAWLRGFDVGVLTRHLQAQFDAFEAGLGRVPDYLDGHRHVHQWPGLRELTLSIWQQRYGGAPAWGRVTRPAGGVPMRGKAALIHRLGGPSWERLLVRAGSRHNGDFLGVYDFEGSVDRYAGLLRQWLLLCGAASLIMCHPAAGPVAGDPIAAARCREYAVWSDPELVHWLADAHCRIAATRAERPAWQQGGERRPGRGFKSPGPD